MKNTLNTILKYIFLISFVSIGLISSENKVFAILSAFVFISMYYKFDDFFNQCKLIEKLSENQILFFLTITADNEEYEFLGYCHIDNKKIQAMFKKSDLTIIKTVKGVQYIGYYTKKEQQQCLDN